MSEEKKDTLPEEEIETFIEDLEKNKLNQDDKIDPTVEQHIGEMGFLWDRVQQKMKEDGICFGCKKEIVFEDDAKAHLVEANKVEKGVVAFVTICEDCFEKDNKKDEVEKNE